MYSFLRRAFAAYGFSLLGLSFAVGLGWLAADRLEAQQTPPGVALGQGQLLIAGTRLEVSPESQTVPFDTPTAVETRLAGFDPSLGSLPPSLRVLADFTGPEIDGVLTLETVPNQPFRIPRLTLKGEYLLDNIRLVEEGELLAFAEPRSAAVRVTQVLVTRVTSRAMTLDEIRAHGIVVDESNFRAFNFTFGFAVDGDIVDYNVPVIWVPTAESPEQLLGIQGGGQPSRFMPPPLAPFFLTPRLPPGQEPQGCMDPLGDCFVADPPPLPGVILFPTDFGVLNQFFSVVLMVQNGAPTGDPLIVRDLTARLRPPAGLRLAETEPPTLLGVPVPVRVPGPDGRLGTGDDLTFLIAQAEGQAEFLVEGLREGTHVVEIDLEGVVEGLPGGIQRVGGTARGAVVVRDPTFGITLAHPDVVRRGEEYTLRLTVANTSRSPANLVTVKLPAARLSGAELADPRGPERIIDSLLPGESELVDFRLRSLRTGRVVASSVRSSATLSPTFELFTGVGENGIPLSPSEIVLPRSTGALPTDLVDASLSLLGLGFSLATAPATLISPDLPQVSRQIVDRRVYQLAQGGRHIDLGEDLFDTAAILAGEWMGLRDGDFDWDLLRRTTQKGALLSSSFGRIFAAESAAVGPRATLERFGATTGFLPESVGAVATGRARLVVESRTSGRRLAGFGLDADLVRDLPYGDLWDLGNGSLALLAVPEDGGYRFRLEGRGDSSELTLLVPGADGSLKVVSFPPVSLPAGAVAVTEIPAGSPPVLLVDGDGDGSFEVSLGGTVTPLPRRPFEALSAVQNAEADPTGHIVEVLFSSDVDLSGLVPTDPGRFSIPGKLSNGGVIPVEKDLVDAPPALGGRLLRENRFAGLRDTRVVRVVFDNPISPLVAQSLTVRDVVGALGEAVATSVLPVRTSLTTPGIQVEGQVIGPDGQPVPFAAVELLESDENVLKDECVRHRTAAVRADELGRFRFDYVRQTECGGIFTLRGTDPTSGRRGRSSGRVRQIGEVLRLDVVMVGRGGIRGRVLYDDGTVPRRVEVIASSPVHREGRQAVADALGYYQADDLPVGTLSVSATDGQGGFALATVEIPAAGVIVERDLVIQRRPEAATGSLRGRVLEADGSGPAVDAWVALYDSGSGQLMAVLRSDVDGRFDFGTVPAGVLEIEAFDGESRRFGARVFFEVEADRVREVEVLLRDERGAVEGRVLRQTTSGLLPVAGAVVFAAGTPFHTVSAADGTYRLDNVFAGNAEVRAVDLQTSQEVLEIVTLTEGGVAVRDLIFPSVTTGGIAGQVLGFDGLPVAGATVHIAVDDQRWNRETVTDATGRFTFTGMLPGAYRVHAVKGTGGGRVQVQVRFAGDTPFAEIRFEKGTIRGRVLARDASGALVGTRSVIRYRVTESRLGLVGLALRSTDIETAADGTFEIADVLVGDFVLTAFNALQGEKTLRGQLATAGEVVDEEIIFERNGAIRGTVLDVDGVTPVPAARVNLVHPSLGAFDLTTDAEGRFAFELVAPSNTPYFVDALFDDGMVFRRGRVQAALTRFGQELEVEVVLLAQGTVSGRVVDASGVPVPAADVSLQEAGFPRRLLTTEADETGAFVFHNVFAGMATLSARSLALAGIGGKTVVEVTEDGEEISGVEILLQPTARITGRVLSPVDGSPVGAAQLQLVRGGLFDSTQSEATGDFAFELLPLGPYELRAFDPATGRQGRLTSLVLGSNGQELTADVVLEGRGEIAGHVFEPASTVPVVGAPVTLRSQGIVPLTTYSSTDGEGSFGFLGVPQGPFTLSALEPQGRRRAAGAGELTRDGERLLVDLFLEESGGATGRVLAPDGVSPFAGSVNVRLFQDRRLIGASFENPYRFDGIIAGRPYFVQVEEVGGRHRGEASGTLTFEGEVGNLDVALVPRGRVTVAVADAVGNPVHGAAVQLTGRGFYGVEFLSAGTGTADRITFDDVGAGKLTAVVEDPLTGLTGSLNGTLGSEGETVTLTVLLEAAGVVQGRLLLSDGLTPAVGALAALTRGSRTYFAETDTEGRYRFPSVPLGAFRVDFQESFGPGTRTIFGGMSFSGQVIDFGDLALDDQDPRVLSVEPASGSLGVSPAASVRITFSEPIDTARFTSVWAFIESAAGERLFADGTFEAAGTVLVLTPKVPLDSFSTYRVRVTSSVLDLSGRALGGEVQTSFTTADVVPPSVVEVSPADGSVQVPLDTQIRLVFSEPVIAESLSGGAISLVEVASGLGVTTTFLPDATARQVVVTPVASLASETLYRLTVQGVTDVSGNIMLPFVSTLETVDATAPTVALTVPASPLFEGVAVALSAEGVDSPDLAAVSFFADDVLLLTDAEAPFTATFTPGEAAATAGSVTLSAVGRDRSGNLSAPAVAERSVQPDLAPEITVAVDPAAGVVAGGRLVVRGSVSDPTGIVSVVIGASGTVQGEAQLAPLGAPSTTFSQAFDVPPVPAATLPGATLPTAAVVTVIVRAVDRLGKVAETAPLDIPILPDLEAPAITLLLPLPGAVVTSGDQVTVSAAASDNVGIARVDVSLFGETVSLTEPPFVVTRMAPVVTETTPQVVRAEAVDLAGNASFAEATISVEPLFDPNAPRVEGFCPAEGDRLVSGLPVVVAAVLSDDELLDSYRLLVDGVLVSEATALARQRVEVAIPWTPPAGEVPGSTHLLRLEANDLVGGLGFAEALITVVDPASVRTGDGTLTAAEAGASLVLGPGIFTVSEPLPLTSLELLHGARLIPAGGHLSLDVAGSMAVACGAALDATGGGFPGGTAASTSGGAPAGVRPSVENSGGSHGGVGGGGTFSSGVAGEVFDSVYRPAFGGGGGGVLNGAFPGPAGAGGGVIEITAARVVLEGVIRARGEQGDASEIEGSGAGGTVVLRAGELSGSGSIDVSGGDALISKTVFGPGGGGRAALIVDSLLAFDPSVQVRAWGGAMIGPGGPLSYAGAGTVVVSGAGSPLGRLRLDNGREVDGSERLGPATELPALGSGTVDAFESLGLEARLTSFTPWPERWLGAWMALSDVSGGELGVFRVVSLEGMGAILEGAGGVVGAVSYEGRYRFDSVEVVSASLSSDDPIEAGEVVTSGTSGLPSELSAVSMRLTAGAHTVPTTGSPLRLSLTGTLSVEAGAVLDATGVGFPGGTAASTSGGAPAGVRPSVENSGGSHGGVGGGGTRSSGVAGEIFDSVYRPAFGGGGGGVLNGAFPGPAGAGGGVIEITAARVVLEGEIRARGEQGDASDIEGSGAGGTFVLRAGELTGSGSIDVSGGDALIARTVFGPGGGGRAALIVDSLVAFDPSTQVRAWGGAMIGTAGTVSCAGPGTIYLFDPVLSTFGSLLLKQRPDCPVMPTTPLPLLGSGVVGTAEADARSFADLWIEPADPATLFDLGVVGMWVRVGGSAYEVVEKSADRRRVLLAGAAGLVAVGDLYEGLYQFDDVSVDGGAVLEFRDRNSVGFYSIGAGSGVIGADDPVPDGPAF